MSDKKNKLDMKLKIKIKTFDQCQNLRLSLSNIQEAARIALIKTKQPPNPPTTERELELGERAFINGAFWAKNIIENNEV